MSPQNEALAVHYAQILEPLDVEVKLRIISLLSSSMLINQDVVSNEANPWEGLSGWENDDESYDEITQRIRNSRICGITRKIEEL